MSKALEDIILYLNANEPKGLYCKNIEIIKTALKRLEEIDNPKIVGTTTVNKALEEFLIQSCPDVEKKLKALEIIKRNVNIAQLIMAVELSEPSAVNLLKEVLL